MTNILASWELGLRYGHVAMLDAIARPLADAGHQVTLAARDVATAMAVTRSPVARIVQAPVYLRRAAQPKATVTYGQVIGAAGFADPIAVKALTLAWLALFDLAGVELVVAEHAPVSLLAAHVAGIPAVRMGTPFSVPPATRPMPRYVSAALAPAEAGEEPDHQVDTVVDTVLQRLDRPAVGGLAGLLHGCPAFLASWPELDFTGHRAGLVYYGPLAGLDGIARPSWPEGTGPRLFVYLPFHHPAAAMLAEVLGTRGWPTLWHSQERPVGPLPPSVRYVAEPIDIAAVLPAAAAAIGRGGHGLAAAALRHGVPSMLFPDTLEAALNTAGLVRAQLAVAPAQPGQAAIAAALDQLIGDVRIAAACAQARARYGRYDAEAAAQRMASDMLATIARREPHSD